MAEMLVRMVDKVSPDPALSAQLSKRGDVIVICDDGHPWSEAERAGDPWVIVKIPRARIDDLALFVEGKVRFDLDAFERLRMPAIMLSQALTLRVLK